jgi:hypothetical protein
MIGSNYSDDLRAAGLNTPGKLLKQWDFTVGIGGPIVKDRLWYRVAMRDEGQHRTIPNVFPNLNAGDPTKFLYAPDPSREVRGAESWRLYTVRLTYQATSKDKFNVHWDEQHPCNGSTFSTEEDGCRNQPESGSVYGPLGLGGLSSTTSPEIGGYLNAHPRVRQVTWSETATNRMLFEAGVGLYQAPFGPYEIPGNTTRPLARVTEQCSAGCSANGGIPNLTYRSANWSDSWDAQYTWRGSVSYVTGAHNLKVGYGGVALVSDLQSFTNDQNLAFTFNNGVPTQLTQSLLPTTSYRTGTCRSRAGPVDDGTDDAAGRCASTATRASRPSRASRVQLPAGRHRVPETPVHRLQGPLAARRRRLRPLRQRQDGGEGELRQHRADQQQQQLHPLEPDHPHATTTTRTWTDANNNRTPDCNLRLNTAQICARTAATSRRDELGHVRQSRRRPPPTSIRRSSTAERAFERLAWGHDPAAGAAAGLGGVGYFQRWLNLHRDRQPGRRPRLHPRIQHHRAGRRGLPDGGYGWTVSTTRPSKFGQTSATSRWPRTSASSTRVRGCSST